MTAVDPLVAFVLARIGEEEADARAAHHQSWPRGVPTNGGVTWGTDQRHAARQDPAATLARCTALRALVALHGRVLLPVPLVDGQVHAVDCPCHACGRCHACGPDSGWPCLTLRHVAAIWRDHPDWREEWAG